MLYTFASPDTDIPPVATDPCNPSPCGLNAECRNGICNCISEYRGDPYRECRPECIQNSDCPYDKACANNKCINPCNGICGQNAECAVVNHIATCSCIQDYEGDPFTLCKRVQSECLNLSIICRFLLEKNPVLLKETNLTILRLDSACQTLRTLPLRT